MFVKVEGADVTLMNVCLISGSKSALELCQRLISRTEPDIVIGDFSPFPDAGKRSVLVTSHTFW